MEILGLGDVKSCNKSWIFLANDTREKANKERLEEIHFKAIESVAFYNRMYREVYEEYKRRSEEADKSLHYITEDEIKEAYAKDRKYGFKLSLEAPSNNENVLRKRSAVFGLFDACRLASDRGEEARKLLSQSETALKSY